MNILYSSILIFISLAVLVILSRGSGFGREVEKHEGYFAYLCVGTSIWAAGFALMLLSDNEKAALILRGVALLGMHICMFFCLLHTQAVCKTRYSTEKQRSFLLYISMALIMTYFVTVLPETVTFVQTPNGMMYTNNRYIGRYVQIVVLAVFYILWFQFSISFLLKSKLKRDKVAARCLVETGILMVGGAVADILIPLLGTPMFPVSVVCAFLSVLLILRSRRVLDNGYGSSENISDIIFQNADVAFVVLDSDFTVVRLNKKAREVLGTKEMKVVGDLFFDYTMVVSDEMIEDIMANLTNRVSSFTNQLTTRYSGIEILAESDIIYDRYGQVMNVLIILKDCSTDIAIEKVISESHKEVETANKAKETFMNKISAGLRQPLESIIDSTNSIEPEVPDMVKPRISQIKESANNLLGTMNDIIDIASIESKGFVIDNIKYDMKELLREVVDNCARKVNEEEVVFVSHINSSMPRELIGDAKRIKQVISNLLLNAVKYTEKGFVILYVEYRVHYRKVVLNFQISDTGCGIKKEDLETVFGGVVNEGDEEISTMGSGLGLSLCRNIIKLMGGEISVKSAIGRGTSFTFSIEQKIDSEKSVVPFLEYHDTVLLIETDQVMADAEEKTLKEMGLQYDVVIVPDILSLDAVPKEGYYSVIFASAQVLRRHKQMLKTYFPNSRIVSINNYHSYHMLDNKDDAICAPLFFDQISDVLKKGKNE